MAPTRERRSAHDPGVVVRDLAVVCRRRRRLPLRPRRAARPGGPVRGGRLREHRPPGAQVDRRRGAGSDPRRSREALKQRLGCGRSARGADPLDLDASLLTAHSEKEGAAGTYKSGFGFHPLLCYLAETGEPLAARPSPRQRRRQHRRRSLRGPAARPRAAARARTLTARSSPAPTSAGAPTPSPQDCRDAGIRFSVGYEVDERVREAILALPDSAWEQAIDAEGKEREGAQVTELTDHARPLELARGHAADRPPRATPPRRPVFGLRLPDRLPPHRLHHRPRRQRHRRPGAAPPPPCPGRGLDPHRQGDRDARHALRSLRAQPGLAGDLADRAGAPALGVPCSAWKASLPSPSPSAFASASCTS